MNHDSVFRPLAAAVLVFATLQGCANRPAATAESAQADRFPVVVGDKWGYIDKSGQIAIQPEYEQARQFREGLGAVRSRGKWGFVNEAGRLVIAPQFEEAAIFREGRALFRSGESFGFIDRSGKVVVPASYKVARAFHDGRAAVLIDNQWAYLDTEGKFAFPERFATGSDFSEGLALVRREDSSAFIDTQGKTVVKGNFQFPSKPFREGLAAVFVEQDGAPAGVLGGFIDKTGKFAIAPKFQFAMPFREGLALVADDVHDPVYRYVNTKGETVIPPRYGNAGSFQEGRAYVEEKGKFGYIDRTGALVIPIEFDEARSFDNGLAWVEKGKDGGYIDLAGKWVWRAPLPSNWVSGSERRSARPKTELPDIRPVAPAPRPEH